MLAIVVRLAPSCARAHSSLLVNGGDSPSFAPSVDAAHSANARNPRRRASTYASLTPRTTSAPGASAPMNAARTASSAREARSAFSVVVGNAVAVARAPSMRARERERESTTRAVAPRRLFGRDMSRTVRERAIVSNCVELRVWPTGRRRLGTPRRSRAARGRRGRCARRARNVRWRCLDGGSLQQQRSRRRSSSRGGVGVDFAHDFADARFGGRRRARFVHAVIHLRGA